MVEAITEGPSTHNNSDQHDEPIDIITVGRLVEVASRTWPGINKPGGVARVVQVHFDGKDDETNDNKDKGEIDNQPTHVNVRYIVGSSREKRIPIEYVKLAPQYETNQSVEQPTSCTYVASSLRDRSMLLGRCRRCGSLRTDCGSCDWAMEEEVQSMSASSSKPRASRRKTKRTTTRADSLFVDDDNHSDGSSDTDNSSSSSSNEGDEDNDMVQLRKLIRQSKEKRKHRKQSTKEKSNKNRSIVTTLELKRYNRSAATSKWRRRYPMLIDGLPSSSSDSSDSEKESKSRRKRLEMDSLGRKSQRLAGGTSILESLHSVTDGDNGDTNKQSKTKPMKSLSKSLKRQSSHTMTKSIELSSDSDSDLDDIPISSVLDRGKHNNHKIKSLKPAQSGEALVDIPLNTANSHRSIIPNTDEREDSYDQQLLELEARARFQMQQQQQQPSGRNDEDVDFIQPEGQEAVENLPEDMVDLSRDVPYHELGPLFDSMAAKLEDEILPDFRLKMAGLHYRLRNLQKKANQQLDYINDPRLSKELLEEYHGLWEEVRSSMIRNGTDQCRAALRRLLDDRLYKKHRKKLTAEQRRKCRGSGIMDARNLRMDAMDEAVEEFVRKLKQAVVACETECETSQDIGSDIGSNEGDVQSMDVESDKMSSDEEDNLIPITAMVNNEAAEMGVAPLQPHQHSTRVRKERFDETRVQSKSKSKSSKNSRFSKRKRPRPIDSSGTGGECQSATRTFDRIKTTDNDIDPMLTKKDQQENESTTEMDDFPNADKTEESLDGESKAMSTDSNKRTRRTRQRSGLSRNMPVLTEPRDPKQSISERMQAFLDANKANEVCIFSDDEKDEGMPIPRREATNYPRRRRQNFSIFEPRTWRRGIQNDDSIVDDHVTINERGDIVIEEDTEESRIDPYDTQSLFDQLSSKVRSPAELTGNRDNYYIGDTDRNWEALLSEMENVLKKNPQSMNSFLQKVHHVLIGRGSRIIQDLIASKDTELLLHVRTLSLCVRSLGFVSNEKIPIPFSKEKQGIFLDLLVFQLVDALYSISIPSAWALRAEHCEHIFQKLIPLRNALASQIPLIEAVSKCIINNFGCQQWRKSTKKGHVFVSSIDPDFWSNFLNTGTKFEDPRVTRFQKLGRVWPRIEVDALWRILAFVGAAPSASTEKSIFRLQIVSKLFSSGVLAVEADGKNEKSPPREDQLLACQKEILYFSSLLRRGALDSLPKTDSMIVKLIQHSLNLQRDSLEGNSHARASCFPNSSDDGLAKKSSNMFWRISHPLSVKAAEANYRCISITDFSFDQSHINSDKTYKMLLYPTSRILRSCITLLINWINRVSTKKIRRNRLTNSLKVLQNELVKEANNRVGKPVSKENLTFENAFSVKPPIEVGVGLERASIFKIEAASYLQIITSMCMKNTISANLSQSIWKTISDDEMKKKQCHIIEHREKKDKYTGDAYRLFATAKIMATLLLLQMNISPWHLSIGVSVTKLFTEQLQLAADSFSFPLSCVFACLECLCDLQVKPHVFSHLYQIIILIFRNLSAMIVRGERSIASEHLRSNSIANFNAVLTKCIRMHLTSSVCGYESFHLRLCLSSIRALQSFAAMRYPTRGVSGTNGLEADGNELENVDSGDDMWGDLDDSDLAALDLACISGCQSARQQQQQGIWDLLSDALEQSKPSKRFAILRNNGCLISGSELQMNSIGKLLIVEEVDKICDCLSTILASLEPGNPAISEVKTIVSKWCHPSYDNDEDSHFLSQIEKKLTSELCFLAEEFPTCRSFVSENADKLIFNFLKALVDSSRLEKLPSCNLERIGETSGRVGTEQAMLMLDLFNDDSFQDINDTNQGSTLRRLQNRRRKNVTAIWDFCIKMGTAFTKSNAPVTVSITAIGNSLRNLDDDLVRKFYLSDDVISLENEIFKVFRLIRNIVSYSATNMKNFLAFESIASCLLMLLANHILSIAQSLKYNDQTSSDKEYKKAKLTELLDSFADLFVSSAAWILQEGAKNRSKVWCFLQTYLRDRLFSPILRKQSIDTTVALQEIIAASRFVHAGPHSENVSLPAIHCVGIVGCSKYIGDCFFASILRRSRQLIAATAFNQQNLGLQNAILEAVSGCSGDLDDIGPWLVGSSFSLGKKRWVSSRLSWPYSSPIQKQIDEYLEFVNDNLDSAKRENNDDWWNCMAETKISFLKNHIVPRLKSASVGIEKKRRILMLLSHILENDAQITRGVPSNENRRERTVDVNLVRDILKCLRSNLHKCLMQYDVNDDLARAIFSSSTYLANSYLLIDDSEQNLVSWSRKKIVGVKGKTMLDLTNSEVLGSYVWIFFQWLRSLGELVIDGGASENMLSIRRHWTKTQCCRLGGMDEELLDLEHLNCFETLDRLLIDFEDLAMPSKTKTNKNIVVNIYAKSSISEERSSDESLLLKPWKPSISVKKNLKEVMAAILTTS